MGRGFLPESRSPRPFFCFFMLWLVHNQSETITFADAKWMWCSMHFDEVHLMQITNQSTSTFRIWKRFTA